MDSDISVKHNMHGGTGTGRGEGKWEDGRIRERKT